MANDRHDEMLDTCEQCKGETFHGNTLCDDCAYRAAGSPNICDCGRVTGEGQGCACEACPQCAGSVVYLGILGFRRLYFRCRHCGWTFGVELSN